MLKSIIEHFLKKNCVHNSCGLIIIIAFSLNSKAFRWKLEKTEKILERKMKEKREISGRER